MARSKGWVSIWRNIQDHELWKDKPFAEGQAWIDLIMMANHEDGECRFRNETIHVKRGSFVCSELKLMKQWGWSKEKLRRFFRYLEQEGMISKKAVQRRHTVVSILNYDLFQRADQFSDQEQTKNETNYQTNEKPMPTRDNGDRETNTETILSQKRDQKSDINNKLSNKGISNYISYDRLPYGVYRNVLLSDEELRQLQEQFPDVYMRKIDDLSRWMHETGKAYKNHYQGVVRFIESDTSKGESSGRGNEKKIDEGERGTVFSIEDYI